MLTVKKSIKALVMSPWRDKDGLYRVDEFLVLPVDL